MRVFVTGASGHLGSAVLPELLAAGHEVVGLARSDGSAAALTAAGAKVCRGTLDDLDTLRGAASDADGVIHLAFKHYSDFADAIAADLRAIEAIGEALRGTGKPFVQTSGTAMLAMGGLGRTGTEQDTFDSDSGVPRIAAENATLALAGHGVRSSVLRLPPTVHSSLDHHGFVPTLIRTAREKGVSAYVGDGTNRWPAVHTLDAARLYRLALESAPAGARLHAVADEGVPFRDIAAAIGGRLGVPVGSVSAAEAGEHFGFLGSVVPLDNPTTATRTRELLDWHPTHPALLADLAEYHYFN